MNADYTEGAPPTSDCWWTGPRALSVLQRACSRRRREEGRENILWHGRSRRRKCSCHFLRGGVSGRLLVLPIVDLSAGLRMRKEHMRLSSTAMTAPALSNSPQ